MLPLAVVEAMEVRVVDFAAAPQQGTRTDFHLIHADDGAAAQATTIHEGQMPTRAGADDGAPVAADGIEAMPRMDAHTVADPDRGARIEEPVHAACDPDPASAADPGVDAEKSIVPCRPEPVHQDQTTNPARAQDQAKHVGSSEWGSRGLGS